MNCPICRPLWRRIAEAFCAVCQFFGALALLSWVGGLERGVLGFLARLSVGVYVAVLVLGAVVIGGAAIWRLAGPREPRA